MIKIKVSEIIFWIVVLIYIIMSIYGTYVLYTDVNNPSLISRSCVIASGFTHFIIFTLIIIGLCELSKKKITINIDKIKQNLKQLIK